MDLAAPRSPERALPPPAPGGPPPLAWAALRSALVVGYGALLVLASVPDDLGLRPLQPLHARARHLLKPLGLRFSHEVFPGQRGDAHPHRWALRAVAIDGQGGRRVLEEWPAGLQTSTPWLGEDPIDTALYRALSKGLWAELSTAVGTPGEAEAWTRAQRRPEARRVARWFCRSPRFRAGGEGPAAVRLEVFASHRAWSSAVERHGRGTLAAMPCWGGNSLAPELPPDPPAWYRGP
jgi:hypothetical protein